MFYTFLGLNTLISKIFVIKEINNLHILKGHIYGILSIHCMKFDIILTKNKNGIDIKIHNMKEKKYIAIILKVFKNFVSLYKEYNNEEITQFIKLVNKNKTEKEFE